jgi:DNA-binding NtrC family response regulator
MSLSRIESKFLATWEIAIRSFRGKVSGSHICTTSESGEITLESGQNTQAVLMYLVKVARKSNVTYPDFVVNAKRQWIRDVLTAHNWNENATARELGMHRNTLYRTMKELGIEGRRNHSVVATREVMARAQQAAEMAGV